jgi:hypothetical protein
MRGAVEAHKQTAATEAERISATHLEVIHPPFKLRNNAQLAAQLAASMSHVALIGPN